MELFILGVLISLVEEFKLVLNKLTMHWLIYINFIELCSICQLHLAHQQKKKCFELI